MKKSSNAFGVFLLGTAVGAALGILLAPDAGEQTRDMIAEKAKDTWEEVKDQFSAGEDKLDQYADEAKSATDKAAGEAKAKFDQYTDKAESATNKAAGEAKSKLKDKADDLNDKVQNA